MSTPEDRTPESDESKEKSPTEKPSKDKTEPAADRQQQDYLGDTLPLGTAPPIPDEPEEKTMPMGSTPPTINEENEKTKPPKKPRTENDLSAKTEPPLPPKPQNAPTEPYDPKRTQSINLNQVDIPGYEILKELGRGGMGVVYQAKQEGLGRIVALKMILAGGHASKEELSRFRAEAEAVAQIQHQNIVQIFHIGEHENLPFFSLEFCSGGSLDDYLDGTPLPPDKAVELLEILAKAMHTAHESGIVHRDLKPANILLQQTGSGTWTLSDRSNPGALSLPGEQDKSPLTLIPKITDFGLAKKLNQTGQTQSGAIMGTPSYMAPEQAGDTTKTIGPHTDVYALGAILYECLTGRPPFKSATPLDTVMQVLNKDPVPPIKLQPQLPKDIQTICMKCLRKDPHKRYASSMELAEDLYRFRIGEPIKARPISVIERGWRWAKRHPAIATSVSVAILAVLTAIIGVTIFAIKANNNATLANIQKKQADEERQKAERSLYAGRIALAHAAWLDNNILEAERLLEDTPHRFRHWEHGYLHRLCSANHQTLEGHEDQVWSVGYSPDGKRLVTGSSDHTVILWNVSDHSKIKILRKHKATVWSVDYSPDGRYLVSGSKDKTVIIWDANSGQLLHHLTDHKDEVWFVRFSPNSDKVATAGKDRIIRIYDVEKGTLLQSLEGHEQSIWSVAFHPEGKQLASGGGDYEVGALNQTPGELIIWDLATGKSITTQRKHTRIVTSVDYSATGQHLATGSYDRKVFLWDTNTWEVISRFEGHTHFVGTVKFSPDGKHIASGSCDKTAKLWDIKTGKEVQTFHGHTNWIPCIAFHPGGQHLATASRDQTVQLWKVSPTMNMTSLDRHTDTIFDIAVHPRGDQLATASEDRTVRLWRIGKKNQLLKTFDKWNAAIYALAYSPDGHYLAVGGQDGKVRLLDVNKGLELFVAKHDQSVLSLTFDPSSQRLAVAIGNRERFEDKGQIVVWDVRYRRERFRLSGHRSRITDLTFSKNGKRLYSTSGVWEQSDRRHTSGELKIWDMNTGNVAKTLHTHRGLIHGLALNANNDRLALVSEDQNVSLWDTASWKTVKVFRGHTGEVYRIVFTDDGRRLITASQDQTIKIWEPFTGQELLSLHEHTAPIYGVVIHPKGHLIASAGEDHTVKLWTDK